MSAPLSVPQVPNQSDSTEHGVSRSPAQEWLEHLGLRQYTDAFERSGYDDWLQLRQLEEHDLDSIAHCGNVTLLPGHRKKLLLASRQLGADRLTSEATWKAATEIDIRPGSDACAQPARQGSNRPLTLDPAVPNDSLGECVEVGSVASGIQTNGMPYEMPHDAHSPSTKADGSCPSPERRRWNVPSGIGIKASLSFQDDPPFSSMSPGQSMEGLWAGPADKGALTCRQQHRKSHALDLTITSFEDPSPLPPGAVASPTSSSTPSVKASRESHTSAPGKTGPHSDVVHLGPSTPSSLGVDVGRASGSEAVSTVPASSAASRSGRKRMGAAQDEKSVNPQGITRSVSNAGSVGKRPLGARAPAVPVPSKSSVWNQDLALCIEGRPYRPAEQEASRPGSSHLSEASGAACGRSSSGPGHAHTRERANGIVLRQPGAVTRNAPSPWEVNQMERLPPERNAVPPRPVSAQAGWSPSETCSFEAEDKTCQGAVRGRPLSAAAASVGDSSLPPAAMLASMDLLPDGQQKITPEARASVPGAGTSLTAWLADPTDPVSESCQRRDRDHDGDGHFDTGSASQLLEHIQAVIRGLAKASQPVGSSAPSTPQGVEVRTVPQLAPQPPISRVTVQEMELKKRDLEALHKELESKILHMHPARHEVPNGSASAVQTPPGFPGGHSPAGRAREADVAAGLGGGRQGARAAADAASALAEVEARINKKLDELAEWTVKETEPSQPAAVPATRGSIVHVSVPKSKAVPDIGDSRKRTSDLAAPVEALPPEVLEILSACKRRNAGQARARKKQPTSKVRPHESEGPRSNPPAAAQGPQHQQGSVKSKLDQIEMMIESRIEHLSR